jgi:hypothetical protein
VENLKGHKAHALVIPDKHIVQRVQGAAQLLVLFSLSCSCSLLYAVVGFLKLLFVLPPPHHFVEVVPGSAVLIRIIH